MQDLSRRHLPRAHGKEDGMKWQTEIFQVTMAVLRRTTREITPAECAIRITTVLDNVYMLGKYDESQKMKESVDEAVQKALGVKP